MERLGNLRQEHIRGMTVYVAAFPPITQWSPKWERWPEHDSLSPEDGTQADRLERELGRLDEVLAPYEGPDVPEDPTSATSRLSLAFCEGKLPRLELLRLKLEVLSSKAPPPDRFLYRTRLGAITALAICYEDVTLVISKAAFKCLDGMKTLVPIRTGTTEMNGLEPARRPPPGPMTPKRVWSTYAEKKVTPTILEQLIETEFRQASGEWVPVWAVPTESGPVPVCFKRKVGATIYVTKRDRVVIPSSTPPSLTQTTHSSGESEPSPTGTDDPDLN